MFGIEDILAGLKLEKTEGGGLRVPNWNYYGSSDSGAAGAAVADIIAGGQLLAQAVMAASELQPSKSVKSVHIVFARAGKVSQETNLSVDTIQDGRTIGTLVLRFEQQGRAFATATVVTHQPDPDVIRHAEPSPNVEAPGDGGLRIASRGSHDIGFVPGTELSDPDEVASPDQPMWVRFPGAPDDGAISQALLAFVTNFQLVGIAMRPHAGLSQEKSHIDVSTGVLSHTISFHEAFDARDWLLLDQHAPHAGNGRYFGSGNVFSTDGKLVASFTQDGIIRRLAASHGAKATL
jgi:acyl-CoA thioesterase